MVSVISPLLGNAIGHLVVGATNQQTLELEGAKARAVLGGAQTGGNQFVEIIDQRPCRCHLPDGSRLQPVITQ